MENEAIIRKLESIDRSFADFRIVILQIGKIMEELSRELKLFHGDVNSYFSGKFINLEKSKIPEVQDGENKKPLC
jgi:hypothetical protein